MLTNFEDQLQSEFIQFIRHVLAFFMKSLHFSANWTFSTNLQCFFIRLILLTHQIQWISHYFLMGWVVFLVEFTFFIVGSQISLLFLQQVLEVNQIKFYINPFNLRFRAQ